MLVSRNVLIAIAVLAAILWGRDSKAFSVIAHQGLVDEAWGSSIEPILRRRFPDATAEQIANAQAFAHGGSHLADLGYFPLGSRLFSDLLHYVLSGDFIRALLKDARGPEELAFALGALAHHVADSVGHPEATNPSVARIYPELAKKYGDSVTYAESPAAHLQTEFRFDLLYIAKTRGITDRLHHAVAFQVPEALLARAFQETYGVGLDDLFASTGVAIATYRWGFRELVHEATGIAWQLYQADVEKLDPTATAEDFVYDMSRGDFERQFGTLYKEPGSFAKVVAWLGKLVPSVGPLRRLPYKPLPEDVQTLFLGAYGDALRAYQDCLNEIRSGKITVRNLNLDVGKDAASVDYAPAENAIDELVAKLEKRHFDGMPEALRKTVVADYERRRIRNEGNVARKAGEALAKLETAAHEVR